jgi:hypothetical protein
MVLALASSAGTQQNLQSVIGVVRDSGGAALEGADVNVGGRRVITNPQGAFRVDSLRPGVYLLTIRRVGYQALRSRIEVTSTEPVRGVYVLTRAATELPTIVVEARRTGIYGTVADSALGALPGAKVQVSGAEGGEMITDSAGRFSFPKADRGQYLVRVTLAGYAERRFLVELKKGEGRELAMRLSPSSERISRSAEEAVKALGLRLAVNLARERMGGLELARYESTGICDVNRITSQLGRAAGAQTLLILNGVTVIGMVPVTSICSWRADEVALVEFGSDICRDVTRTIPDLVGAWCESTTPSGRARAVPRSIMSGGGRIRTQGRVMGPGGTPFVVVWEKK